MRIMKRNVVALVVSTVSLLGAGMLIFAQAAAPAESLTIRDLRAELRVTSPQAAPLPFHVVLSNPTDTDYKNLRLSVWLNGRERPDASVPIPLLAARERLEVKFHLHIDQLGFQQIAARLESQGKPVEPDTTRYTAVEVRQRLPVLLIDGDNTARAGSDRFYMEAMFGTEKRRGLPGYQVEAASAGRLEEPGLDRYPSIYLCNVRELSDKAIQNLDAYVKEGGGVAFFLGDRIDPAFYNKKLFADGKGLFPAPLAERPSMEPTKAELEEREKLRLKEKAPEALLIREPRHPLFRDMDNPIFRVLFRYELNIDRHFPIVRTRWDPKGGQELASLPNTQSVDGYKDAINKLLERLPLEDPKYKTYAARLKEYRDYLRNLLDKKEPLHQVADWFDKLLFDAGDPKNKEKYPNLKEFWALQELAALKTDVERLRDAVRFGDPLLIEGRYGNGRVLVCTTTLGAKWNNLAAEPVFAVSLMCNLQNYLVGAPSWPTDLTAAERNALWKDLGAAPGTATGDRALATWLALPRHSLAYFKEQLKAPPAPPARLEETVGRLISELDSKEPEVRATAAAELRKLGMWAEPALRRALTRKPSAEQKKQLDELIQVLDRLEGLPAEQVRLARALDILSKFGTPEARQVLEQLAKATPETWVNERARAALQ